ncbi:n-acetylglutamate synthase [Litorimonas sp. RW-G-Af-16]|uniref:n-acetylglutamate synthase n=1 Tax=Litorimonas sp. RW-G-Af-16 TaxID=3241168 RepID=UPI00390CB48F
MQLIWYGGRLFRPSATVGASQTSPETIFKYEQRKNFVTATYAGGEIEFGQLMGNVLKNGSLDMRYHHRDIHGTLHTGTCLTTPEVLPGNKLRLREQWQWTSGDRSRGETTLEEI